jgi:hypothetical protein
MFDKEVVISNFEHFLEQNIRNCPKLMHFCSKKMVSILRLNNKIVNIWTHSTNIIAVFVSNCKFCSFFILNKRLFEDVKKIQKFVFSNAINNIYNNKRFLSWSVLFFFLEE